LNGGASSIGSHEESEIPVLRRTSSRSTALARLRTGAPRATIGVGSDRLYRYSARACLSSSAASLLIRRRLSATEHTGSYLDHAVGQVNMPWALLKWINDNPHLYFRDHMGI
jgi:hypothetical protein